MSNLTVNRPGTKCLAILPTGALAPVSHSAKAATHYFAGCVYELNSAGDLQIADGTGIPVGFADAEVDNTLGLAGDLFVEIQAGWIPLDGLSLTKADLGKQFLMADNHTVKAFVVGTDNIDHAVSLVAIVDGLNYFAVGLKQVLYGKVG